MLPFTKSPFQEYDRLCAFVMLQSVHDSCLVITRHLLDSAHEYWTAVMDEWSQSWILDNFSIMVAA